MSDQLNFSLNSYRRGGEVYQPTDYDHINNKFITTFDEEKLLIFLEFDLIFIKMPSFTTIWP